MGFSSQMSQLGFTTSGLRFPLSDWPMGLLETCIEDYTRHEDIRSVIAVMSDTTDYAKLVFSECEQANGFSLRECFGSLAVSV
jgi:hypothetical protein